MGKVHSEDKKHSILVSTYIYNKFLSDLSFKERIELDLGNTSYNIRTHSDTYNNISCEELSIMLAKLKKPWWNYLYEKKIKGNTKVLLIFNLLLNIRHYKLQTFKLLYKVLKVKKEEFNQ